MDPSHFSNILNAATPLVLIEYFHNLKRIDS